MYSLMLTNIFTFVTMPTIEVGSASATLAAVWT